MYKQFQLSWGENLFNDQIDSEMALITPVVQPELRQSGLASQGRAFC